MKKRKIRKPTKVDNAIFDRKKRTPLSVFLITLIPFLLVGIVGLAIWKTIIGSDISGEQAVINEKTDKQTEETGDLKFFWETIPEDQTKVEVDANTKYAAELADEEYRRKNHILAWEAKEEETVTIGFIGDILFDDEYAVMANLLRRGVSIENGISEPLLAQMQETDILIANNEFPYTNRGTPLEGKTYTFRADTESASYLHDMGVDVAVLANNHIYDFGEIGLLDTLDTLTEAGIPYIGAGRNIEEASAPLYFIANDIKIAVVAATQIERLDNPDTKGATENTAGTFRCWNPEKLYETIAQAKENSDFVIVYVHWGTENETEPDWAQLEQAAGMEKAGADLIIGDHPHCLQGVTYYGETPVVYSLGNFWFNSKTVDTGMVQAKIGKTGLEALQFIPAIQADSKTDLAYGTEKESILTHLRNLSPEVQIDGEGYIGR